jgi:hypothetical protein
MPGRVLQRDVRCRPQRPDGKLPVGVHGQARMHQVAGRRRLEQRGGLPFHAVSRGEHANLGVSAIVAASFARDAEPLILESDQVGRRVVRLLIPDEPRLDQLRLRVGRLCGHRRKEKYRAGHEKSGCSRGHKGTLLDRVRKLMQAIVGTGNLCAVRLARENRQRCVRCEARRDANSACDMNRADRMPSTVVRRLKRRIVTPRSVVGSALRRPAIRGTLAALVNWTRSELHGILLHRSIPLFPPAPGTTSRRRS